MEARGQAEVAVQQRAGPPEDVEQFVARHNRRVYRIARREIAGRTPATKRVTLAAVPKLSVTVITSNEEEQIEGALASVAWADEIVVVDSNSTDQTVSIARTFTDRVVIRDWAGYVAQKNF